MPGVRSEGGKTAMQESLERALQRDPNGRSRATIPVVWASSAGLVRKENQDRILIGRAPSGLSVAILADGMGGLEDGSRAAVIATSAAAARALQSRLQHVELIAEDAIEFANEQVFRVLRGRGGAAMVLAVWTERDFAVVHAGDARAYVIDSDGSPHQVTIDDTVAGQLAQMGRPAPSEPDRGLLQFAGVGPEFDVRAQGIGPRPRGVVLTSDGIHNMPPEVFRWIVNRSTGLQALADHLVQLSEWNGGEDNATAICIGGQSSSMQQQYQQQLQLGPDPPYSRDFVECWVPGTTLMFASDVPLASIPRILGVSPSMPTAASAPPVSARSMPATPIPDKPKKKGIRERRAAKKSKRTVAKHGMPASMPRPLPIEVTFEPPDDESDQSAEPPSNARSKSTKEN